MILELGVKYIDGDGYEWTVSSISNGQSESIGPCTCYRWEGKRYITRIFRRDGTYSVDVPQWNLIQEVEPMKVKMNQNVKLMGTDIVLHDGEVYNAHYADNQSGWELKGLVFVTESEDPPPHRCAESVLCSILDGECEVVNPEYEVYEAIEQAIEIMRDLPYPTSRQADLLEFWLEYIKRHTLVKTFAGAPE